MAQGQDAVSSAISEELWLIRTQANWIAGPYPRSRVVQMVQTGELGLQDEVCKSNSYWIFLHEREELLSQLGVEVPRTKRRAGEDVTETDTRTVTGAEEPTDPDLEPPKGAAARASSLMAAEELPELSGDLTENTAILTNRRLRMLEPNATHSPAQSEASLARAASPEPAVSNHVAQPAPVSTPAAAPAVSASVRARAVPLSERLTQLNSRVLGSSVDRPSLFRNLSWVLILAACALAYAAMRLLNT